MRVKVIKEYLFKFNTPRRIVQLLSFVFFSAIVFNLGALAVLVPVLWAWGLPQNVVGDSFTALQLTLYEAIFPWLAISSFLIVGILIGKSLCGWVCPFGFVQDLVFFIRRKKTEFSPRTHDTMIYVKHFLLCVALFVSVTFSIARLMDVSMNYENALGIFAKVPFTILSPAETLFAVLPRMILGLRYAVVEKPFFEVVAGIAGLSPLFWVQFIIIGFVLVFVAITPRGWCRYFCPHGAIMGILNKFSFIGLRRDPAKCAKGGCRLCVQVCPMRVPILDLPWEKFSHDECIYCLKCVDSCADKAIKLKYP